MRAPAHHAVPVRFHSAEEGFCDFHVPLLGLHIRPFPLEVAIILWQLGWRVADCQYAPTTESCGWQSTDHPSGERYYAVTIDSILDDKSTISRILETHSQGVVPPLAVFRLVRDEISRLDVAVSV